MRRDIVRLAVTATAVLFLWTGCQTAYYAAWEKMGKEKRHLLKDNIEKVQRDQEKASRQFESTLEQIQAVYGLDGGDIEKFYRKLSDEFSACENRAAAVRERIDKVERIASDLFSEWKQEIDTLSRAELKTQSRRSLEETRASYARLQTAMLRARESMPPVLTTLRDYVLFLKHNLNALAIGSIRREVRGIEAEVDALIADMNRSIAEAQKFLKTI